MERFGPAKYKLTLAQILRLRFGWTEEEVARTRVQVIEKHPCWTVRPRLFRGGENKRVWIPEVIMEHARVLVAEDAPRGLRWRFRPYDDFHRHPRDYPPPLGQWVEIPRMSSHNVVAVAPSTGDWKVSIKAFRYVEYLSVPSYFR